MAERPVAHLRMHGVLLRICKGGAAVNILNLRVCAGDVCADGSMLGSEGQA